MVISNYEFYIYLYQVTIPIDNMEVNFFKFIYYIIKLNLNNYKFSIILIDESKFQRIYTLYSRRNIIVLKVKGKHTATALTRQFVFVINTL